MQKRLRSASSARIRSTSVSLLGASLACALLSGCNLGPVYQRPELPVPADWREAKEAQAAWPSTEWWQGFNSVELNGHIDQARRANLDIAAAMARVREADAQAGIAGAPLLPTLSGQFSGYKERILTTSGTYIDAKQVSPQLAASYMVDFWGKNRATRDAAQSTATASRNDQAVVELTILTSVAQTYFQMIELRERVEVAQSNLDNAQKTLAGLRRQLDAGIVTMLDVTQEETVVATLSAALPPLRQQLRQFANALAILLGQPPQGAQISQARLADLNIPVVGAGLPSELLARRPDIAEAENQLIAANANIRAARAAFFPSLTLTASGGVASNALSTLFNGGTGVYALTAGIVAPIFDGGVLHGQYDLARARYDELAANYRKAVLNAYGNVENALVAVQQTVEQEDRQRAAVTAATRAYDLSQQQLRSGTVNIITVLNTQNALFSARDALVQARYAHLQAVLSLYSALGGGWQNPDGKVADAAK